MQKYWAVQLRCIEQPAYLVVIQKISDDTSFASIEINIFHVKLLNWHKE